MLSAAKFANFVLVVAGLFCAAALLSVIYFYDLVQAKQFTSRTGLILYHAVPFVLGGLFFASLRLGPARKVNLALLLVSSAFSLYALEFVLSRGSTAWFLRPTVSEEAIKAGVEFDARDKLEVIDDLRKHGIEAYPTGTPKALLRSQTDGSLKSDIAFNGAEALPLGWISNKVVVFCNENGYWVTYESDERGFHNPKGIWQGGRPDIAALGDSFGQGFCVPSEKNFVALLRGRYPATLNLSISGNGPLLMLAGIEEYLRFVRPKAVLWFFFEGNDLCDLKVERHSPLLMRYAAGDYSQGLLEKQAEIDRALAGYVGSVKAALKLEKLQGALKLRHLRQSLGLVYAEAQEGLRPHFAFYGCRDVEGAHYPDPFDSEDADLLRAVLRRAKDAVGAWGGALHFVYLPEWQRYKNPKRANSYRDQVLAIVKSAGLPLIDLHETFRSHPDPLSLFPFRQQGHYNMEGHRVVADAVLRSIRHPL